MEEEIIDFYDEKERKVGEGTKEECQQKGYYQKVIHLLIYNNRGELIIQLRNKNKKEHSNKWDYSVTGHIRTGEEPREAAIREAKEELGIEIRKEELEEYKKKKIIKTNKEKTKIIAYVYFNKTRLKEEDLTPQKEELQEARFISLHELEEAINKEPEKFAKREENHKDWKEYINEIRKRII